MSNSQLLTHFNYICNEKSLRESKDIIRSLKNVPFVECNNMLVLAKELYDPRKVFFKEFRRKQLPSKEWCTDEHLAFLVELGLCSTVTGAEWLDQAKKFAFKPDVLSNYERLSDVLYVELENIIKASKKDAVLDEFLSEVSKIPFIVTTSSAQYHCLLTALGACPIRDDGMMKFDESVSHCHASLAFAVCSILPKKCDKLISDPSIGEALGIRPIEERIVLQNLKYLCGIACKKISKLQHDTFVQSKLKGVLCDHCRYLDKELSTETVVKLLSLPCLLIDVDGVIRMVKPAQVVEQLPSACRLDPFRYLLPPQIAQHSNFTKALGIKKELMAEDYCDLLTTVFEHTKGDLNDRAKECAKVAYHELIRCIRLRMYSKEWSCKGCHGYLMSREYQLFPSCELLYNDVPWYSSRLFQGKYRYILSPQSDHQGSRSPPELLNVCRLSDVIKEKIHKSCMSCDALCTADELNSQGKRKERCIFPRRIIETLHSPEFAEGILRIYYHEHECRPPKSFQEAVNGLQKIEVTCLRSSLKTVLCDQDGNVIPKSEDSTLSSLVCNSVGEVLYIAPHGTDEIHALCDSISSQLNLFLKGAIKDVKLVAALFKYHPSCISSSLTQHHRIKEFSMDSEEDAPDDCEKVGDSLSPAVLTVRDAVITVNFKQGEMVRYYSPTGDLILAKIVKSHNAATISRRSIELITEDTEDEMQSILVSPIEVFKSLSTPQINCLRNNDTSPFISPVVTAVFPPGNPHQIKQWVTEFYNSEDLLMYSGLLVSLVKIRLLAHFRYLLHVKDMTPETFKCATFQVLHCAANHQLPCTPICDNSDLSNDLDSLCCGMQQLSIDTQSQDDSDSNEIAVCHVHKDSESKSEDWDVDSEVTPPLSETAEREELALCARGVLQPAPTRPRAATRGNHSENDYARYQRLPSGHVFSTNKQPTGGSTSSQRNKKKLVPPTGKAYSRFTSPASATPPQSRFTPPIVVREPPICREKAQAWLEQAKVDYQAAEKLHMSTDECQFPALVCFLCHDVVEKCLKGIVYVYCEDLSPGCINLVSLYQQLKSKEETLPRELLVACNEAIMVVSAYENKTRYPHFHNPVCAPATVYTRENAVEALSAVNTLMKSLDKVGLLLDIIGELTILPKSRFVSSMRSTTSDSYPESWDKMKEDEEVKIILVDPETESEEYKRVQGEFNITLPQRNVIKVYRVQNKRVWAEYYKCSQQMLTDNEGIIREEMLFHGTRHNNPRLIYESDSGFDMRHSAEGLWGRGNYFAKNSRYSDGYAYSENGTKKMFAAWVLTGKSYESQPKKFIKPPEQPQSHSAKVRLLYDSVTGVIAGTRVYVTYDNKHAYPAYLIVYE